LEENQFVLSRFVTYCCAADAYAVGLVVDWTDSSSLVADEWVVVRGKIEFNSSDENLPIFISAEEIERIPQPLQPYIFP